MPRDFYHLPYNRALLEKARELRKNPTPAEKKLWHQCLRTFEHRVLRQRPIIEYIVDFYIPALGLVLEIDGDSHFTEEGIANDAKRTRELENLGLRVVRFTNGEILESLEGVAEKIVQLGQTI
jgi:very-short-patch-repair endonuclease